MLKTILLSVLLAVVHAGTIRSPGIRYIDVEVQNCSGELETIYQDKKMTTLMPNPFVSDALGNYRYYSLSSYERIILTSEGERSTISTCKEAK